MSESYNKESNINHTFAVCAYKESPYLEECVVSLVKQTIETNIILCTSTPNEYINNIANKYGIEVFVRKGSSDIQDDWNFAYEMSTTDLVTIAHQDDIYSEDYVKELMKKTKNHDDMLIFITDYIPIKNGELGNRDINSKIRRLLRTPLKLKSISAMKVTKKFVLAFGNSICCPSVTYNKKLLGKNIFTSKFKFALDWDTFLKIAKMNGRFIYADKPLTNYRVHDGATSKEFIVDERRVIEDVEMFTKFWPKSFTKFLMAFYKLAYRTYD